MYKKCVAYLAWPFRFFHPNVISLLGVLLSLPGFYFYSQGEPLWGCLFVVGVLMDVIDGAVARMTKRVSRFGGIFDATLDRLYDGFLYMSIAWGQLVSWPIVMLAYILSVNVSYIKAKAEAVTGQENVGRNKFSVGVAGRVERIVIVVIGSLLQGLFFYEEVDFLLVAFVVLCVLTFITIFWRGWEIYRILN